MYKIILLFISIIWNLGLGTSVKILQISVPPVADLQDDISLDCTYDMGGEELNSVKWYKEEEEFFRYAPGSGGILVFPVAGAHAEEAAQCNNRHCSVTMTQLSRSSAGAYRCEVSTEAPTFRVAFETANMTIVAFPRGEVSLSTPRREYSEGEEIRVNCTSPPSDPPPKVRWLINDRELTSEGIEYETNSLPDERGLISRTVVARLIAHRELFMKHTGLLEMRCEVTVPQTGSIRTPPPLTATVYMSLLELRRQKFDWLSSSGSTSFAHIWISACTIILFVLSQYIW